MIYRIHPNIKDFFILHLEGRKARKALGDDTDFYIDERPFSYADKWQPMEVGFSDAFSKGKKEIPDISSNVGKLYLNEKAYLLLKELLNDYGEFLPVFHGAEKGYIFNCLTVNEVDERLSVHDPLNDKYSVVFNTATKDSEIFKAKTDYNGHFCTERFKEIVESNDLQGISFSIDTGNPFPEELGMKVTH